MSQSTDMELNHRTIERSANSKEIYCNKDSMVKLNRKFQLEGG